jgi:hypothetical protein
VHENHWLTVRSIEEQVSITREQKNLNTDMRKVCKNGPKEHAHTVLSVREFLASKQITVPEHRSYSRDLAPITFPVPEDKGILYNFTVNATYLFEYFVLHVSTTKGYLQMLRTTYIIIKL